MDNMSLFNVLTVSVPEAIVDVFLGLLIIGEKQKVEFKRSNVITLLICSALMAAASFGIRSLIPIGIVSLLVHVPVYSLLFIFFYRLKPWKAVMGVIFFIALLVTIESLYFSPYVAFINSYKNVLNDDMTRLIVSMPERIIQISIALVLWNSKSVYINMRKYDKAKKLVILIALLNLCMQSILWYILLKSASSSMSTYLTLAAILFSIAGSVLLFKLVTKFTRTINIQALKDNEDINIINYILRNMNKDKSKDNRKTG